MELKGFGTQSMTDEDRSYEGSSFSDVHDAIFANRYQKVWGGENEPPLPIHEVTLSKALRGLLPFARKYFFRQAAARTVDSGADLRWGEDGTGFSRIIHANGVCLSGRWEIDEETEYSGYFRKGSRALLIARYSTCCTETFRGQVRSLALVGKLFPTKEKDRNGRTASSITQEDKDRNVRTASFITQEDIGGKYTYYINDAELRNSPDVTALKRAAGVPIRLVTGLLFTIVDKQGAERQLYAIAELGKPADEPTRCPRFMRLPVAAEQPRIEGRALDFRDEIMEQIYDRGCQEKKRSLVFNIVVSDEGSRHGFGLSQYASIRNWRRIGHMTFDEAVISYNGDCVLHFNHPTWRTDRNDPSTGTRVNERRVR